MRVLVIEDEDDKYSAFAATLLRYGVLADNVVRYACLTDLLTAASRLGRFDLCFIDFFLPFRVGDAEVQSCVSDILKLLDHSPIRAVPVLAISRHSTDSKVDSVDVRSRGIMVYDFEETAVWEAAVGAFCQRAKGRYKYDFIGVLALEEERLGFLKEPELRVEKKLVLGLNAWEVQFFGWVGCLFCLPRMGLVDASIISSRVLSYFEPKVVFMSGICGGSRDTEMGQLLVSEFCWEYQSGKWYSDGFRNTPYQEGMLETTKSRVKNLFETKPDFVVDIERKLSGIARPTRVAAPQVAIFASGSAVIASSEMMKTVESQHRKVKGVDMEIFGVARAVALLQVPVEHFCCKVVVDKADEEKNDNLHEYGCALSALASLELLREVFLKG